MSQFEQIVIVSRLIQISLALLAFSIAIASCIDYHYNNDRGPPNGYLMMACIMCCFDNAALGCIGLLALLRPQDLALYLVFLFDILALAASIAAGKCATTNAKSHYRWDVTLRITVILAYLCIVPIVVSILRTVYVWYVWWQDSQGEQPGRIQLKEHSDVWTLEQRVEQLEAEARTRPFSTSETIARWSTFSGDGTLSQCQSEKAM